MFCALVTIGYAPRAMDLLVCALGKLGLITLQGGCRSGAAGLGEGGLFPSWSMLPSLLVLILIMEAALWLQRIYAAPSWLPPLVVALGCPALQSVIAGLNEGLPWFVWQVGIVMGLPIALAFTAYWVPMRLSMSVWPGLVLGRASRRTTG